jgi:hypothetical protein
MVTSDDFLSHITWDDKVYIPQKEFLASARKELPPPLYKGGGVGPALMSAETRLHKARLIVYENEAAVEVSNTKRLTNFISSEFSYVEEKKCEDYIKRKARAGFNNALKAIPAVINLLNRKAGPQDAEYLEQHQDFLTTHVGEPFFRWEHAEIIWDPKLALNFNILKKRQNVYRYEDVGTGNLLKVSGIPLKPPILRQVQGAEPIFTKQRLGLFETNLS